MSSLSSPIRPLAEMGEFSLTRVKSLLRVECPEPQGTSIAIGYDEIRVIFNRFEGNIEDFSIERVSEETGKPKIPLDN